MPEFSLFVSIFTHDPYRDRVIAIRNALTSRIDHDEEGKGNEKSEKKAFRSQHIFIRRGENDSFFIRRMIPFFLRD